jgi:hypothetical protein
MAELINFDKTLHLNPGDAAYANTYKGMAHVAGTGPYGATRRTCKHWGTRPGISGEPDNPGYYSNSAKGNAGCLKEGYCNYPIPGKADRRFPHSAGACKFHSPTANPFPASKGFQWGED